MRGGLETVSLVILALAALLVLGRWYEASALFYPSKEHSLSPSQFGLNPEEVTIDVSGVTVHGWYFSEQTEGITILYAHGNAGTIADRLPQIKAFVEQGINLFIYDYRGYGKSGGTVSKKNFLEDSFAAYDYLVKTRGLDPRSIVLLGQSLGGVAVLRIANRRACRAVILEGTFYSVRQIAKDIYPVIPVWLIASSEFDNSREVKKLKVPVLFIYGKNDSVIPGYHSEMLFKVAPEPRELLSVDGSDHTSMYEADPEAYFGAIKKLVR